MRRCFANNYDIEASTSLLCQPKTPYMCDGVLLCVCVVLWSAKSAMPNQQHADMAVTLGSGTRQ